MSNRFFVLILLAPADNNETKLLINDQNTFGNIWAFVMNVLLLKEK